MQALLAPRLRGAIKVRDVFALDGVDVAFRLNKTGNLTFLRKGKKHEQPACVE
jgi:hypothetical protein